MNGFGSLRTGRAALAGAAVVLLAVAVGATWSLAAPAVTAPLPSVARSAGQSSAGSASDATAPSSAAATPSATASSPPSPSVTARPATGAYHEVLREHVPDHTMSVVSLAERDDVLLALGYEVEAAVIHAGPYTSHLRLWRSTDEGTTWSEVTGPSWPPARGQRLLVRDDGFWLIGSVEPVTPDDPYDPFATWHSLDGLTWRQGEFATFAGTAADWSLRDVAVGPRGWVALAVDVQVGSDGFLLYTEQIWHSRDGHDWSVVREAPQSVPVDGDETYSDVAAGPEGFVVAGALAVEGGGPPLVLASSDGRAWHVAPEQPAFGRQTGDYTTHVAALGNDWVMTGGRTYDGVSTSMPWPVPVWFSHDGLAWELAATIEDPDGRVEFGWANGLVGNGSQLWLTTMLSGFLEQNEAGVWTSTDGHTWERMEIDPAAGIGAIAPLANGDVLLAGHTDTVSGSAVIWRGTAE